MKDYGLSGEAVDTVMEAVDQLEVGKRVWFQRDGGEIITDPDEIARLEKIVSEYNKAHVYH